MRQLYYHRTGVTLMLFRVVRVVSNASRDGMLATLKHILIFFPPNVLFLLTQDEKALNFLLTVPQNWRLLWAIEYIGDSLALAVVAIIYIGDFSPLSEGNNGGLLNWPNSFVCMVNPAAATVASVLVSSTLQTFCDYWSEACDSVDAPTLGLTAERSSVELSQSLGGHTNRI